MARISGSKQALRCPAIYSYYKYTIDAEISLLNLRALF
jgi:hypothetical protein